MLIKYIKSVLWSIAKRLSYIEDAWCLKFKDVRVTPFRNDPHAHSSECQDMNCDSLSGLTNARSASVLDNRAMRVNALQYVYWKGPETGVSKFRTYGAAQQKRARPVCTTAAGSFQQCSSLSTELFSPITKREVVLPYRRFGTTYRSHLHG